jgi:hypothetical protein
MLYADRTTPQHIRVEACTCQTGESVLEFYVCRIAYRGFHRYGWIREGVVNIHTISLSSPESSTGSADLRYGTLFVELWSRTSRRS